MVTAVAASPPTAPVEAAQELASEVERVLSATREASTREIAMEGTVYTQLFVSAWEWVHVSHTSNIPI